MRKPAGLQNMVGISTFWIGLELMVALKTSLRITGFRTTSGRIHCESSRLDLVPNQAPSASRRSLTSTVGCGGVGNTKLKERLHAHPVLRQQADQHADHDVLPVRQVQPLRL